MTLRSHFNFFLLLLMCLTFLIVGLDRVNKALNPGWEDTTSYLGKALFIKENGGILNFVKLSVTGQYKWVPQHPLYLLILSPFAERSPNFFPKAKLVSLGVGLITIITLFFVAGDLYGKLVGLISSFLLVFNITFLHRSSRVDCEPLLILLVLLSWYFMIKGAKEKKYWIYSGIFSGLAYMTKGSGFFMVHVFMISSLFIFKFGILRNRYFWLFLLGFFLTSFPLILRNTIAYKNPFYNGYNSNVIWLDNWEQVYNPSFHNNPPTMVSYFNSHSLSEIVSRFANGSVREGKSLLNSMSLIAIPGSLMKIFCILLFLFFILGLIKRKNISEKVYTVVTILIFFILFSWYYQVIQSDRFITPLIPLLLIFSSLEIVEFLDYCKGIFNKWLKFNPLSILPYVLGAILILTSFYSVVTRSISNPLSSVKFADDYYELLNWMRNNIKENDIFILGPTHYYSFWYLDLKGKEISFPMINDFSEFRSFIKEKGVTFIILHKETYLRRQDLLKEYFEYNEVNGLIEKKPVDGWSFIYGQSGKPTQFRIYRVR